MVQATNGRGPSAETTAAEACRQRRGKGTVRKASGGEVRSKKGEVPWNEAIEDGWAAGRPEPAGSGGMGGERKRGPKSPGFGEETR